MWNINNFWNLCDLENGLNNKIKSPLRGQIVMCVCVCPVFSHGPQPVAIPVEKYQKSAAAATKEHKTHSHPHSTPKRTFKKPKHKKTLDFAQAAAATFLTRRTVKDSARKKKKMLLLLLFSFLLQLVVLVEMMRGVKSSNENVLLQAQRKPMTSQVFVWGSRLWKRPRCCNHLCWVTKRKQKKMMIKHQIFQRFKLPPTLFFFFPFKHTTNNPPQKRRWS